MKPSAVKPRAVRIFKDKKTSRSPTAPDLYTVLHHGKDVGTIQSKHEHPNKDAAVFFWYAHDAQGVLKNTHATPTTLAKCKAEVAEFLTGQKP